MRSIRIESALAAGPLVHPLPALPTSPWGHDELQGKSLRPATTAASTAMSAAPFAANSVANSVVNSPGNSATTFATTFANTAALFAATFSATFSATFASSLWQSDRAAAWWQRLWHVLQALILPALLLGVWQLAAQNHWMPEQILPAPKLVWQSLLELWQSGELQTHLGFSARRVLWSLLIGGGSGLLLGLGMGLSRQIRAYLLPTFTVLAQFPVLGWIPLLIIFAGIDEALKISAISIAVTVPVAVNTRQGIANIPRAWFEVAQVYRFTPRQVIARVVLPAATPSLFNGLRQAVMQAWLTLVFVELLASSEGIGYLMVWGRQLAQLDLVMLGMLLIGVIGVALDFALRQLEARLQRWRVVAF